MHSSPAKHRAGEWTSQISHLRISISGGHLFCLLPSSEASLTVSSTTFQFLFPLGVLFPLSVKDSQVTY